MRRALDVGQGTLAARPLAAPSLAARAPWTASAVGAWVALVLAARLVGLRLYHRDFLAHIGNPPLVGELDPHPDVRLLGAAGMAAALVAAAPALARRLGWRSLLAGASLTSAAWAAALAASAGWDAVTAPLRTRYEYLTAIGEVGSPGAFLRHFVSNLPAYPTHVRGHPPGMVLILWLLNRVGLAGAAPASVLVIAGAAAAVPAVLMAAREVAGEAAARAAAPFVAAAPAALWVATSADALFCGVAAWAVTLVVLATGRTGHRGVLLAAAGGLCFASALLLTYGVLPLALVPLAVAIARRQVRRLAIAGAAAGAALIAVALAGFWWLDGLHATRELYARGVAVRRPYATFLLIDAAAFAVALGPAVAAALGHLRGRRLWLLPGGALAAVALADISGMSRGETERIWLPFAPWVLLATAVLGNGRGRARAWLSVQVITALVLQATIRSPW